ncbi:MAG: ATPase [Deltaproteobacteria bacterium]|nr:ATPase [Deltaproteobacteria bacterium]
MPADSLYAGVDVGASATKVVITRSGGEVVGSSVGSSGMDFAAAAERGFAEALAAAGAEPEEVTAVVATGYGRRNVGFARATKTEITCHARGAHHHFPEAITIVDIGGQDNKIIKLDADGGRADFRMNRKCATGTGAFLEEIARRIELPVSEMEGLARQSTEHVELGSFCTVFSATEILALVRRGVKVPDIVKGAFRSVVKQIAEMDPLQGTVVATGGVVAHNPIVVELLSEAIGSQVRTPDRPQLTGALGAALLAAEISLQD